MFEDTEDNGAQNALFDSDEFSLRILKYMSRDNTFFESVRAAKIKPDDFVSGTKGTKLYKELAIIVFQFQVAPIDMPTWNIYYKAREAEGKFTNFHAQTINDTVETMFEDEIVPAEMENTRVLLNAFSLRRRTFKILQAKKDNAEWTRNELNKIFDEQQTITVSNEAEYISPFEQLVTSDKKTTFKMGMGLLDSKAGGVGPEECGLLLGHSGTGKTAVASFMMRGIALHGSKALYISAEEPARNIVNRWYAQQFNIDYTALYRGEAELEKQQCFGNLTDDEREQLARLQIVDVRSVNPLNIDAIKKVLEQKADKGFIPNVVLIDQMDYLRPKRPVAKNAGKWQEYENVAFDCDELSQYKIAGTEPIALWVLHQATGDMKWEFTYNDIAGFKGIVKPFDLAIGIGREDRESTHINLFSLKVRHSEHFQSPQRADFARMKFEEDLTYKCKAVREKEEKKKTGGRNKKPNDGPTVPAEE